MMNAFSTLSNPTESVTYLVEQHCDKQQAASDDSAETIKTLSSMFLMGIIETVNATSAKEASLKWGVSEEIATALAEAPRENLPALLSSGMLCFKLAGSTDAIKRVLEKPTAANRVQLLASRL